MKHDFTSWKDMIIIFRYSNITRGRLIFRSKLRSSRKAFALISKESRFLFFHKKFEIKIWYQTDAMELRLETLYNSDELLKTIWGGKKDSQKSIYGETPSSSKFITLAIEVGWWW